MSQYVTAACTSGSRVLQIGFSTEENDLTQSFEDEDVTDVVSCDACHLEVGLVPQSSQTCALGTR